MPEESDATRRSTGRECLLAFFDSAATRSLSDTRTAPRARRGYRRHVAATPRGEDAAAALLESRRQGEHHDQAAAFVGRFGEGTHFGVYSTRYCAWTDYPVRRTQ